MSEYTNTPQRGPSPGWYPDPENQGVLRYWDGASWTEHRTAEAPNLNHPNRLPDIGRWFASSWRVAVARFPKAIVLSMMTVPATAFLWFTLYWTFADFEVIDNEVFGFSASRAWILLAVVVGVMLVHAISWMAVLRQMQMGHLDKDESIGASLQRSISRLPRLIGLMLGFVAATVVVMLVVSVLFAVLPLLGVVSVIVLFVGLIWAFVTLAFIGVAVIAAPRNAKVIAASIGVTKGRWWAVFGRLLLVVVISALVQAIVGGLLGIVLPGPETVLELSEDGDRIERFVFSDLKPSAGGVIASTVVNGILGALISIPWLSALTRLYLDGGGPSDPERTGGVQVTVQDT